MQENQNCLYRTAESGASDPEEIKTLMKVKNEVTNHLNRQQNTMSLTNQKLLQCVFNIPCKKHPQALSI